MELLPKGTHFLFSNTSRVRLQTLISLDVSLFSELSISSPLFETFDLLFCIRAIEFWAYIDCVLVPVAAFNLKAARRMRS